MEDEFTTCAALLHDVVEDTSFTLEDIAGMGFPPPVVEVLGLLTHEKGGREPALFMSFGGENNGTYVYRARLLSGGGC